LVCNINYKKSVSKDLSRIDRNQCKRILNKIEEELSEYPEKGKRLTGNYKGLISYRISEYRVVYSIIADNEILILRIAHRKEVYKQ